MARSLREHNSSTTLTPTSIATYRYGLYLCMEAESGMCARSACAAYAARGGSVVERSDKRQCHGRRDIISLRTRSTVTA